MIFQNLYWYADFVPLILRLVLGLSFIVHGYPKLFKKEGREGFAAWLSSMGVKPGKFWALIVGVTEFFGGVAFMLGAFTQVVSALIVVNMFVAMRKAKWGKVGFTEKGGWEIDLAYLSMAVSLLVLGGGAWSLDSYFFGYF